MASDLSLHLLPDTAISVYIRTANDFSSIINLYNLNPLAQKMLGCVNSVRNPTNNALVATAVTCELTPYQDQLLEDLNAEFQLGAKSPLSFPKLVRAYNYSGLNPICDTYNSILECMKSAAKHGQIDKLLPGNGSTLYDKWLDYQRQVDTIIIESDAEPVAYVPGTKGKWYSRVLTQLIALAYNHGHLSAYKLWSLLDLSKFDKHDSHLFEAVYRMIKAWLKFLLRPYKIRRSRDIRAENYVTLYDLNVPDKDKAAIWVTQYQIPRDISGAFILPSAQPYADQLPPDGAGLIDMLIQLKFGVITGWTSEIYSHELSSKLRSIYSVYSGDEDIMAETQLFGMSDFTHDVPIMAKRGYFETLGDREGAEFDWNDALFWSFGFMHLSSFFTTFTLKELIACTVSLSKKFGKPLKYTAADVLIPIVKGNLGHLYADYVTQFAAPSLKLIARSLEHAKSKIRDIPMLNQLFAMIISLDISKPLYDDYRHFAARNAIHRWLDRNTLFLAKIWTVYGRQQFEDTLMYLRPLLDATDKTFENVTQRIPDGDAPGLAAYCRGYKLTAGGTLQPMSDSPILSAVYMTQNDVLRYPDWNGNWDMTMLLLRLVNMRS